MMSQMIHIVDDDAPFRAATARLLRLRGYAVAEYPSAENFLEHVGSGGEAGCVLLDVSLPGLSGPDLQARLTKLGSLFPIVFLTGYGDVPMTVRAMRAGAEDVLTKPVSQQALVDSIERAFAHYETEHTRQEWVRDARSRLETLTPREREVFEFVVRGKINKQTAHALGITERTIKAHRQRIFDKLGARTIADLVSLAERLGVLADAPATNRSHTEASC